MPTLRIRDLSWAPPSRNGSRWRLDRIGLDIEPGQFVGLIGPNGSGKTSLLRCAYRYTRPDSGQVLLDGEDLWAHPPRWSARRIAVMLQEFPQDFGLTVADVVSMGRTPHQTLLGGDNADDLELVERILGQFHLAALRHQPFALLSGGEKQRVLLARALVQQPRLLILDEPTNHLDPRYQLELLRTLRQLNLTTLASFHDLNLAAAFCDRLIVMVDGRVLTSGTPAEVLTAERLSQVFGVPALVDRHPIAGHPRITWITES